MGAFLGIVVVGAAVVAVLLHFVAHVSTSVLLGFGAGALCLLWLAVLLTVPWNLYFQARTARQEITEGRAAGLEIAAGREQDADRISRRLLRAALGAHLVSAVVVALVAAVSGQAVGYWFCVFYLLATVLRPGEAWLRHLRARIGVLREEASFPRDDIIALKARLDTAESGVASLDTETRRLALELDGLAVLVRQRDDQLEARIHALGRKFEDTLGSLTDNQEVINGLRAFLRLLREDRGADAPQRG
ncbi:hypothetical protein DN069_28770 [Streptacidiphilus pinicola]|uniref:Uncharacterized protein n=1 Tax=Streptacidiphilus pinicola TaxID=2219663 RepID=A0A2X0K3T3_9ACTN|nr:hypothetical protein [Streptacidiphilus pinicola]RAG82209.1 hypothetical protein DN069_28770 [Streptacidiphilus pinicola]